MTFIKFKEGEYKRSEHPTIVITSETSYIGQLATIEIAKHGSHLVLIVRSKNRSEVTEKYSKIDVFIHIAGFHAFEQRVTFEVFPEMIAVY